MHSARTERGQKIGWRRRRREKRERTRARRLHTQQALLSPVVVVYRMMPRARIEHRVKYTAKEQQTSIFQPSQPPFPRIESVFRGKRGKEGVSLLIHTRVLGTVTTHNSSSSLVSSCSSSSSTRTSRPGGAAHSLPSPSLSPSFCSYKKKKKWKGRSVGVQQKQKQARGVGGRNNSY